MSFYPRFSAATYDLSLQMCQSSRTFLLQPDRPSLRQPQLSDQLPRPILLVQPVQTIRLFELQLVAMRSRLDSFQSEVVLIRLQQ